MTLSSGLRSKTSKKPEEADSKLLLCCFETLGSPPWPYKPADGTLQLI
jgi:hypothetical protein